MDSAGENAHPSENGTVFLDGGPTAVKLVENASEVADLKHGSR
jgi:hypothetical protein